MSTTATLDPITTIKYQIKNWEYAFKKEHNAQPSKEDVKNDPNIAKLYREYKRLKYYKSTKIVANNEKKTISYVLRANTKNDQIEPQKQIVGRLKTPARNVKYTPVNSPEKNTNATPAPESNLIPAEIGPTPQLNGRILGLFELSSTSPSKPLTNSSLESGQSSKRKLNFDSYGNSDDEEEVDDQDQCINTENLLGDNINNINKKIKVVSCDNTTNVKKEIMDVQLKEVFLKPLLKTPLKKVTHFVDLPKNLSIVPNTDTFEFCSTSQLIFQSNISPVKFVNETPDYLKHARVIEITDDLNIGSTPDLPSFFSKKFKRPSQLVSELLKIKEEIIQNKNFEKIKDEIDSEFNKSELDNKNTSETSGYNDTQNGSTNILELQDAADSKGIYYKMRYKKKGQKRTTRRSKILPNINPNQPTNSKDISKKIDEFIELENNEFDENVNQEHESEEEWSLSDDSEHEEEYKFTKDADSKTKKKVEAHSHQNYVRLKIKNNKKGINFRGGYNRFRR
ncbi:uncharacterized protein ASCRUDRAFT_113293 [Ascoidea rubescens DSM 1968]|uniref:DNA replication regulator SLD2 n=1 Tax=Ascoidea rubescens DSM 1968 TaxID=1344418 RepID=A0A1D2VC04_9ASCO|nr:hypothetical protein ASCRUDRAFT_113293 [Ascoidea rubescens DSM 1968]ODV59145.1 hypothetical protein ASCRUDRAFT_113293 [Ascoidea rubescens DSM 1968]